MGLLFFKRFAFATCRTDVLAHAPAATSKMCSRRCWSTGFFENRQIFGTDWLRWLMLFFLHLPHFPSFEFCSERTKKQRRFCMKNAILIASHQSKRTLVFDKQISDVHLKKRQQQEKTRRAYRKWMRNTSSKIEMNKNSSLKYGFWFCGHALRFVSVSPYLLNFKFIESFGFLCVSLCAAVIGVYGDGDDDVGRLAAQNRATQRENDGRNRNKKPLCLWINPIKRAV